MTTPVRTINLCATCRRPMHVALDGTTTAATCGACGAVTAFEPQAVADGTLHHCPWCGCPELYRQRDFHQTLGCALMLTAAAISLVIHYVSGTWWWLIPLAAGVAIDAVLFRVLPDRAGCYRCHAEFRNVPNLEAIARYDLHAATRIEYAGPRRPHPDDAPAGPAPAGDPPAEP